MLRHRIGLSIILSLAACMTPSQPSPVGSITPTIQVETGRAFEIAVGQEARVQGTSVRLRFLGVSQDSRCPSDVQCVWAGNAIGRFALSGANGSAAEASLNTTLDPKSAVFSGFRITFVGLKPVPKSGTAIPPGAYVATLEVSPA